MTEQLELPNIIDHSKDKWELKIDYDQFADSPRSWDNLGKICVSRSCKYTRDESGFSDTDELEWCDRKADLNTLERKGYIVLPLSVYDHSGVRMYIGSPCDRWDSGQIGWYIVSKEDVRKEYGYKRISKKLREKVESILESEINTYNAYINGDVYNFTLYHNDEEIDSCGGFYDDNDEYRGFIRYIYDYLPKIFKDCFTVEQAKEMAIMPW